MGGLVEASPLDSSMNVAKHEVIVRIERVCRIERRISLEKGRGRREKREGN